MSSTPQTALNVGLDYRGPQNWFASVNFNYYDKLYLSMNPFYRTAKAIEYYTNVLSNTNSTTEQQLSAIESIREVRKQECFGDYYTLSASVGKNWYIGRYMLGFSLEVKNILNNQDIRTGGYEQMRMNRVRASNGETRYKRFDSKYFYMLGTNYYLNVYLRF